MLRLSRYILADFGCKVAQENHNELRICGSCTGGYVEFYLLGYNAA
jgi:hypothetical protein